VPSKSELLVLVGPMGVGKTTVGRKLAKALKVPFIDTDALIVDQHGEIAAYFEAHGEPAFREVEHEALAKALAAPAVVATGGGAVLLEKNQQLLKGATVIYLSTDGKHIGSRLKNGNRPLIKSGVDDWKRIYNERKPIYEKVADLEIDTAGQSLNTTISEIREKLGI